MDKNKQLILFLVSVFLLIQTGISYAQPMVLMYPKETTLEPGDGYDLKKLRSTAVSPFANTESYKVSEGQSGEIKAMLLDTSLDFYAMIDFFLSADMKGSYKGIGLKGSMMNGLMHSTSIHGEFLYLTVMVKVEGESIRLKEAKLSDEAIAILQGPDGITQFHETYGHKWVKSIKTGGRLLFTLIFDCSDIEHKEMVKAALSGSASAPGLPIGVDINASMSEAIRIATKHAHTSFDLKYNGGTVTNLPSTWTDALALAVNFPESVNEKCARINYELVDFTEIPDYNLHATGMFTNSIDLFGYSNYLDQLAQYRFINNDLNYILSNQERYHFHANTFTPDQLTAKRNEVDHIVQEMSNSAENFQGDLSGFYQYPETANSFSTDLKKRELHLPHKWLSYRPQNEMNEDCAIKNPNSRFYYTDQNDGNLDMETNGGDEVRFSLNYRILRNAINTLFWFNGDFKMWRTHGDDTNLGGSFSFQIDPTPPEYFVIDHDAPFTSVTGDLYGSINRDHYYEHKIETDDISVIVRLDGQGDELNSNNAYVSNIVFKKKLNFKLKHYEETQDNFSPVNFIDLGPILSTADDWELYR